MKNLILILLTGLLTASIYPAKAGQLPDSLTRGKIYNVITIDKNEMSGILEYSVIILRAKNNVYKINTETIQSVIPSDKMYSEFVPDSGNIYATDNLPEAKFDKNKNPDYDALYDVFLSSSNELFASQNILKKVSVKEACGDQIIFLDKYGTVFRTPVNNIDKINVVKNPASIMPLTIVCGAVVGGVIGALVGQASEPEPQPGQLFSGMFRGLSTFMGGVIGVLVGGLTGTVFGLVISQDEEHNLYNLTKSKRIERIKNIIY